MPELFDMRARKRRRDRAASSGVEPFLYDRTFDDCLERIALLQRRFKRALLIGCPISNWPDRLRDHAETVDVRDPGRRFAELGRGVTITEDRWEPHEGAYDLVLALGTLDSVNDLPLALQLLRHSMACNGLLIGAVSGGDTLPQLRAAIRAADQSSGAAAPHVHPRIEASALAQLLSQCGFDQPVVDVDRVAVSYPSLTRLIADVRRMGSTNILIVRPRFVGRSWRDEAMKAFADAGDGRRTKEVFEILHFAAWTASNA